MGLVYSKIRLSNPRLPALAAVEVSSLVDTGAMHLCIPSVIASQLELEGGSPRDVQTPDGSVHTLPYVGPIRVDFENRFCYVGAMVLGDEVLLGAVPMEDMDVIVHPSTRQLLVNPLTPNKPLYKIK